MYNGEIEPQTLALQNIAKNFITRGDNVLHTHESLEILKIMGRIIRIMKPLGPYPSFYKKKDELLPPPRLKSIPIAIQHIDTFLQRLFELMVVAHDALTQPWLDNTPLSFSKFKFTTMLHALCLARAMLMAMVSDALGGEENLKITLANLKLALIGSSGMRFSGFTARDIYDSLHQIENCIELMWVTFHFSTCFETNHANMKYIIQIMAYNFSNLWKWICVEGKQVEWIYKGLSIEQTLVMEDIAVLAYSWERAIRLIESRMEYYFSQNAARGDVIRYFRQYVPLRYPEIPRELVNDTEKCKELSLRVWKRTIQLLKMGNMSQKQKQDFQKMVFQIMLAPGLHEGYYSLNKGVEHEIAPAERMLDPIIHKLCAFFTGTPLSRIANGWLDPSTIAFDENDPKRPHLPDGVSYDGILYRRMCILTFVMQLEKMVTNAMVVGGPFLENYFLLNPDPGILDHLPCRIVFYGTCFYMTNQQCKLIRFSKDDPGEFAFVYVNELKLLNTPLSRLVYGQYKKELSIN